MRYIGIDIGSTAAKVIVWSGEVEHELIMPTGWSSKETSEIIRKKLLALDLDVTDKSKVKVASTGYGRMAVEYADDVITEITCHGKGGTYLLGKDCTVIDVGGQDTKVISIRNEMVDDFLMNDKCAAGTGKFIEVMANRLNLTIDELFDLAQTGKAVSISSLCTVFAESEVINYIGSGAAREDIAAGVVDSVASKVATMCSKRKLMESVLLTGGLSQNEYFSKLLGKKIKRNVTLNEHGRFAGALGAAIVIKGRIEK